MQNPRAPQIGSPNLEHQSLQFENFQIKSPKAATYSTLCVCSLAQSRSMYLEEPLSGLNFKSDLVNQIIYGC